MLSFSSAPRSTKPVPGSSAISVSFAFVFSRYFRFTELLLNLCRNARDKRVRGNVLGNHTSGTGHCTVTDLDRGNEHCVRTDTDIVADPGFVFVLTVVVAGDRAGTDVGLLTDSRVTEICQMTCLR